MQFCKAATTGLQTGRLRDRLCIIINRWWKKLNIVELSSKGILVRQVKAIQLHYSENWILPNMIRVTAHYIAHFQQLISEGLVLISIAGSFQISKPQRKAIVSTIRNRKKLYSRTQTSLNIFISKSRSAHFLTFS